VSQFNTENLVLAEALDSLGAYRWSNRIRDRGERFVGLKCEDCGRRRFLTTYCGHRLCKKCARKRSARLSRKVCAIFSRMKNPKFLTLTVPNTKVVNRKYFARLREAFGKLRRSKIWRGVRGGIYALEATWNEQREDWNIHIHVLCDVKFIPIQALRRVWGKLIPGSRWIHIQRPDRGVAKELAKYILKGLCSIVGVKELVQYIEGISHIRTIQGFGKWSKIVIAQVNKVVRCLVCGGLLWVFEKSFNTWKEVTEWLTNQRRAWVERLKVRLSGPSESVRFA